MGTNKIFCYNCCHSDNINFCKFRKIFIRLQKGRYCQDFVDKTKIPKPIEEIPQPVKPIEEVPVTPVETKFELKPEVMPPKPEIKLKWWQKILRFLIVFFKRR